MNLTARTCLKVEVAACSPVAYDDTTEAPNVQLTVEIAGSSQNRVTPPIWSVAD